MDELEDSFALDSCREVLEEESGGVDGFMETKMDAASRS